MLSLVLLLICITIMIIMYYVWADKTTYFCTNILLLCTVGSIDVFFIAVFESYLNKFVLEPLFPELLSYNLCSVKIN